MTSDKPDLIALDSGATRLHVTCARIALVLVGILYAWTAYSGYDHLRPWRDGSMFTSEPTGHLAQVIDLAFFIIVFTGIVSVANIVLAVIADKKPTFAIYAAMGIFAVYTALRIYQTNGRFLSYWLWWVTAIALGLGFQVTYKANQLRKSRHLTEARLVA